MHRVIVSQHVGAVEECGELGEGGGDFVGDGALNAARDLRYDSLRLVLTEGSITATRRGKEQRTLCFLSMVFRVSAVRPG
jgi:hypothetical protein